MKSHAIWDHTVLPATRQRWVTLPLVSYRTPPPMECTLQTATTARFEPSSLDDGGGGDVADSKEYMQLSYGWQTVRLPTSEKYIVQLSALPVVLCRARRRSYTPGKNNATKAPSAECIWNTGYTVRSVSHGRGALWTRISEGPRHHPPTTVGVRKLEWLQFRVVSIYPQRII